MSIPIGYYERIANEAKSALTETGGAEIIVNTRGSNVNSDEYPAIFDFLLNEVPHRFVDVDQSIPLSPSLRIYRSTMRRTDRQPFTEADVNSSENYATRKRTPGRNIYRVAIRIPPCDDVNEFGTLAQWRVTVIRANQSGESLAESYPSLVLEDRSTSAEEYHWTAQLWDKAGRRWAQVDDNGYPTRYWRAGDVITQALDAGCACRSPVGNYVLRVGQYTWPEVKPVLSIDVAGNPQSDAVEVPVHLEH